MKNGHVVFYNSLNGYSSYPYKIKIFDTKNDSWKNIGKDIKIDFPFRSVGRSIVKSKQVWFTAPLDFNMYNYEKERIKTPYKLDLPTSDLTENFIRKSISDPQSFYMEVLSKNLIYSIKSIRETQNYLVFNSNQEGIFIVNKNNKKVYWEKFNDERFPNTKLRYYPHDGDDDKVMFIIDAKEQINPAKLDGSNKKNSLEMEEDDNPVLIFYKEKT